MITTPTLFILGAGASKPYEFPTGEGLRDDIVKNFATDFNELDGGENTDRKVMARERIKNFLKNFDNSSLKSIDRYLAINSQNDKYIGKIAIALSILKNENKSCFNEKITDPEEDWYKYLYNRMTEDFNKPDEHKHFFENNVAFITFNYDRSLEYYLYNSFFHSFNQESNNIRNNIISYNPFKIIHVYGSVGSLSLMDWYSFDTTPDYRRNNGYFSMVEKRSTGIRVIGEERIGNGESVKDQIKELLTKYKRIFFLGFGFDKANLNAIDLPNNVNNDWSIFGTAKGMTAGEIDEARSRINIKFPDYARHDPRYSNPVLKNVDSCALLRQYLF